MDQTNCCNNFAMDRRIRKRSAIPFLLVLFFSVTSITGYSQDVSLKAINMPIKSVFAEIKKQTGYTFFYDPDLLDKTKKITINVKGMPLEDILDILCKDQPFTYSVVGKIITLSIRKKSTPHPRFTVSKVSGQVRNKLNQPLEGASIVILRTKGGTLTGSKGEFTLEKVEPTDTLTISMIGYSTERVPVSPSDYVNIVLKDAVDKLDEVLKTAYGRTSQRLATGDIVKISSEEIEKQPVMNPMMALQGRVPGLVVTPFTGFASSPVKVELRGRSDLNPTSIPDPLYVVDGVPLTVLEVTGNAS